MCVHNAQWVGEGQNSVIQFNVKMLKLQHFDHISIHSTNVFL